MKHLEVATEVKSLLLEIIEVKKTLKSHPRAWVPLGNDLRNIIVPHDGSEAGYSTSGYARSSVMDAAGNTSYCSRILGSRCKLSALDVPTNEMLSAVLAARFKEFTLSTLPEMPDKFLVTQVGDSTCTAFSLNPDLIIKDRRKRNLVVRWNRSIHRVAARYNNVEQLFVWTPGLQNPADLHSKAHSKIPEVLNSHFWRHGHSSYSSETFPSAESIVYASMTNGQLTFYGLPSGTSHLATCYTCSAHFETGQLVASVLVTQSQLLADTAKPVASPELARPRSGKVQLQLCETAGEPGYAKVTAVHKPGNVDQLDIYERAFYESMTNKFNNIEHLVSALAVLLLWVKRKQKQATGLDALKREVFRKLMRSSQAYFKPENVKQQLPYFKNKIMVTDNRLNNYNLVKFHQNGALPIISHQDQKMCYALFSYAHTDRDTTGTMHVSKRLTSIRMRRGRFAVHITQQGRVLQNCINTCVDCTKDQASHAVAKICSMWPLENDDIRSGIWLCIQLDIIGPFHYISGRETRATKVHKCWAITFCCQFSGAFHVEIIQGYDAGSFISGFQNHCNRHKTPRVVTADAGSQIKASARMMTRSQGKATSTPSRETEEDVETADSIDVEKAFKAAAKTFKDTKWVLAPTEAQHFNGKIEQANKMCKSLMRSQLRLVRKQKLGRFESIFELTSLMTKITKVLNQRAIVFTETEYFTINDVLYPSLGNDIQDTVVECPENVMLHFQAFMEAFRENVTMGHYQRTGKKAISTTTKIVPKDIVMLLFPSRPGFFKYGVVEARPSNHQVEVRMMTKRYKDGSGVVSKQIWSIQNIVLLHRPTKVN